MLSMPWFVWIQTHCESRNEKWEPLKCWHWLVQKLRGKKKYAGRGGERRARGEAKKNATVKKSIPIKKYQETNFFSSTERVKTFAFGH